MNKVDSDSRAMFVARLENIQQHGSGHLTVTSVLALLNDCDMVASQAAPVTTMTSDEEYRLRIAHLRATIEQAARYARNRLSTTHEVDREDWAADLTAIAEMLEGRLRT